MVNTVNDPGPLDWRVSITDKSGRPSPEFQRRWNTNRNNTNLITTTTFGTGAPTTTPINNGDEYVDTSVTPYIVYVGYNSTYTRATPIGANPTVTAGPAAINGSATTYMRSDAAPAVQTATTGQLGLVKPDGSTINISSGLISVPVATSSSFGLVKPDNTTITISSGVLTAIGGVNPANPTATAGPTAVNGTATTFMRSDAAPAVQLATTGQFGLVKPDGTTITVSGGVISSIGGGATPTGALAAVSCSLSGTTITIDRSTNVASVTRTAAGRYRITFTTALSNANYGVTAIGQYPTESGVLPIPGIDATSGYGATTTALDIAFETAAGVFADLAYFTVLIFDPANFTGGNGSPLTLVSSQNLGTVSSWVVKGLNTQIYDYKIKIRLSRPSSGATSTDLLKMQFGDTSSTPILFTNAGNITASGAVATNLTTSGGITNIAQVNLSSVLYMGTEMDLQFSTDGLVVSALGHSYFWENIFQYDQGPCSSQIGSIQFSLANQAWSVSYSLYAVQK